MRVLRFVPWMLLAVLVGLYIAAALNPVTGVFHDDGLYVVTAKSMATGGGYQIPSLPAATAQSKYPVLYPALLAAIWRVFPEFPANVVPMKALTVLCMVGWLAAVFRLGRNMGLDATESAWVCAAVACGRWVMFLGSAVLPDILFCLLSTLALLHAERGGKWWIVLAGVEGGLAYLARTVGVALLGACAAGFALQRRWRAAILFGIVAATFVVPWMAWQRMQVAPDDRVLAYYTRASYETGSLLTLPGTAEKVTVAGVNLVWLALSLGPMLKVPVPPVCFAASLGVLALALARARLRISSIPVLWLLAYSAIVAVWLGGTFRYLVPVLPIALILAALQLRPMHRSIAIAGCAGIAFFSGWNGLAMANSLRAGFPVSFAATELDSPASLNRQFEWIRTHSPPDAVIASNQDPLMWLATGRRGIRPFATDNYGLLYSGDSSQGVGTAADLRNHLLRWRVRYLHVSPMSGFMEIKPYAMVRAQMESACPGVLLKRFEDRDPDYSILEVDTARLRACAMLGK